MSLGPSRPSENPRRLLVFAPAAGSLTSARQRDLLSGEEEGISERDLRIEHLTGDEAAGPRREYGVAEDEFATLLVGRDGGVKLRSSEPVSADELFARIDEMPMRRREMREMQARSEQDDA